MNWTDSGNGGFRFCCWSGAGQGLRCGGGAPQETDAEIASAARIRITVHASLESFAADEVFHKKASPGGNGRQSSITDFFEHPAGLALANCC